MIVVARSQRDHHRDGQKNHKLIPTKAFFLERLETHVQQVPRHMSSRTRDFKSCILLRPKPKVYLISHGYKELFSAGY